MQLTSQEGLKECGQKQLCMIAFLPHILDSLATGRNAYIEILKDAAEKYKQRPFGWVNILCVWHVKVTARYCDFPYTAI